MNINIPVLLGLFTAASLPLLPPVGVNAKNPSLDESVEAFGSYVLYHWNKDKKLSEYQPPQIITNISSDTKVLGACVSTYNGRSATDVGGTSYCSTSNTIYVVQNQIAPLYKYFGPAAVAYIIAHEYGHYIQSVFGMPYIRTVSELQADCLSGAILGQGANVLGITSGDIINMAEAAYTIGSTSHGSGAQRAYAVYAGFGLSSELSCSTADMQKLAASNVKDPMFMKLSSRRGLSAVNSDQPQIHLRSISGSLLGSP